MDAPSRRRSSLRARWHDYRFPGGYFITICVEGRQPVLSRVGDQRTILTPLGAVVEQEWATLSSRRDGVVVDSLVVMPDHLHGILRLLAERGWRLPPAGSGPSAGSVGALVGQLKSRVTKAGIARGIWPAGRRLWQRGYHDRMLRSPSAVAYARRYIVMNPVRWERDHERTRGPVGDRDVR